MNSGDKKYLWQQDRLIKAGLAHLWFVAIHPLEDGNGRIACASGGMVLARAEESVQRFYSLSTQIQRERKEARKSPKGFPRHHRLAGVVFGVSAARHHRPA